MSEWIDYVGVMQKRLDACLDAHRAGVPIEFDDCLIWVTEPIRLAPRVAEEERGTEG